MEISRPQLKEFQELLEDTIEYYCDQNIMSGQLAWTLAECLATAKLAELKGELVANLMEIKQLMPSIENFIGAMAYTYHVDKRELWLATARMCTALAERELAIDPDRNK